MVRRGDALPTPAASDEEASFHRQAEAGVRLKAQRLRRALNAHRVDQAVKVAADLAAELRSPAASALSPTAYYDVYLAVTAELRALEIHISEMARLGAPVLTLYERVQETPLVLPRLYLLVSVGSVYVKSHQADPAEVLRDLVEMCAGVQHPQRGLFLRAYLLQTMKDKLPDVGSPYVKRRKVPNVASDSPVSPAKSPVSRPNSAVMAGEEGHGQSMSEDEEDDEELIKRSVSDSVNFVLRNFTEMNRLWVRSQHDVAPEEADIKRREQERRQLRVLVGSNISTLAHLEGVDLSMYKSTVLPAVLDQIVTCHDAIAQEYLADCVAQVFPDEYQLATLDHFLSMCAQLVRGVNLRVILSSVIDRFARFATQSSENGELVRKSRAFETFREHVIPVMHRQRATMPVSDRLHVFLALASFALKSDPENLSHVDDMLGFALLTARDLSAGEGGTPLTGQKGGTSDGGMSSRVSSGMGTGGFGVMLPSSRSISGVGPRELGDGYSSAYSSLGQDTGDVEGPAVYVESVFSDEEEDLVVQLLTLPLTAYEDMSSALSLTNYAPLQKFLRYGTRRKMAVTLLQSVKVYKPCISDVAMLDKLFDYVASLAEDPPRVSETGALLPAASVLSSDGMFDASSLSPHHEYILASVPGAATFANPVDKSSGAIISMNGNVAASGTYASGGSGGDQRDGENGDFGEEDGFGRDNGNGREFEHGQELISRIVYFCHNSDISGAFALHVALRDRLMRGGRSRVPTTLPPLVLATLSLCTRAGVRCADLSLPNGLSVVCRALHFVVETVDAMRSSAPDTALRLYLQTAMTASAVYRRTCRVEVSEGFPAGENGNSSIRRDAESVQQYVYENVSRSFEVFETGVVTGKAQFAALELVIGALSVVGGALDSGLYEALASRTVKHAQRLLTRSDQCLALCSCASLFWTSMPQEYEGDGIHGVAGGRRSGAAGNDTQRSVGNVLLCVNGALEAANGCVNDGERVLLLVDVGHCIIRLVEDGCVEAGQDGRLDVVFGGCGTALDGRRARSTTLGRAAATRLHRLRKHVKSHPNVFSALALRRV